MRVGIGHDTHRLVEGRPLILGGVRIDHPRGLLGHSDADVVLHAVADALLGAAGLGDIGEHLPRHRPAMGGARQRRACWPRSSAGSPRAGWRPVNCDVIDPRPGAEARARTRPAMRANLARLLGARPDGRQRQGQDRRARRADRPGRGDRLRGGRPPRSPPSRTESTGSEPDADPETKPNAHAAPSL